MWRSVGGHGMEAKLQAPRSDRLSFCSRIVVLRRGAGLACRWTTSPARHPLHARRYPADEQTVGEPGTRLAIGGSGAALATLGATPCGLQSTKRSSVSCAPNQPHGSALKSFGYSKPPVQDTQIQIVTSVD